MDGLTTPNRFEIPVPKDTRILAPFGAVVASLLKRIAVSGFEPLFVPERDCPEPLDDTANFPTRLQRIPGFRQVARIRVELIFAL